MVSDDDVEVAGDQAVAVGGLELLSTPALPDVEQFHGLLLGNPIRARPRFAVG